VDSLPQTLFDQSRCFTCFGLSESESFELALLQSIVQNGLTPPIVGDFIVTDALDTITTDANDPLIAG
jgi:hypothetical protein